MGPPLNVRCQQIVQKCTNEIVQIHELATNSQKCKIVTNCHDSVLLYTLPLAPQFKIESNANHILTFKKYETLFYPEVENGI